MEAQPVTPGAALFSEEQLAALQRLRTAFEQKLLDEDEYKAEKAKVLNATPAAPPPPPADDDDDGFELVGVQTPAERAAESRRRAEAEGNVLEIDDDDEPAAAPTTVRRGPPRAGRFRAPERRSIEDAAVTALNNSLKPVLREAFVTIDAELRLRAES